MSEPRKPIDWDAIEREFRAGALSNREIARQFEISEAMVRKRAKADGWERDLSKKVRDRTRTKLVRDLGSQPGAQEQRARSEAETVETAAERQLQALREHRVAIGRGRDLTLRMLDELDATTSHLGDIESMIAAETAEDDRGKRREAMLRAVGLPSRAVVIKDLSAAAKNWVALERQALGIDSGGSEGITIKLDRADSEV